jgi:hypothetical protein
VQQTAFALSAPSPRGEGDIGERAVHLPLHPKWHEEPSSPADEDEDNETPRQIDPIGAVALGLGCVALLCASVSWLCVFLLPLAGAGFVAGLFALARALRTGRSRWTFPSAGTAVAGTILAVAILSPALLGPTYRTFKDQVADDPDTIRRISVADGTVSPADDNSEWADASRILLQQGGLTVQVAEVSLAPAERPLAKKKVLVRLLVRQSPRGGTTGAETERAAALLLGKHRPTLSDAMGQVYELVNVQAGQSGQNAHGAAALGVSSPTLVFETAATDVSALRLELPAATWGGHGTFHFLIPASMLQRKGPG